MNINSLNCKLCVIHKYVRSFSTSSVVCSFRNFTKFPLYHRGSKQFVKRQQENPDPDLPVVPDYMRKPGYKFGKKFVTVPEMIPEIIVPDLKDCKFKPYVSYRVTDIQQSEFTPQDLFDAIYSHKIFNDYNEGKLDENGFPLEPSEEESLTALEACQNAMKCGSDLFSEDEPDIGPYLPGYHSVERKFGP